MARKSVPFLHRFYGTTPKNAEARFINAWDSVEFDIPELSPSEFEVGSRTRADRATYYRDGSHWALFDGHLGDAASSKPLAQLSPELMGVLTSRIGGSHFFDEGALRLKASDIISRTPSTAYIMSSQRDAIVERLSDYIAANFADVGGNLAVRVHEPSLTMLAWKKRYKSDPNYLSLQVADLRPWQANQFSAGLHFSIDRGPELIALGKSLISDPNDDLSVNFDLDGLELLTEPTEEMSERSLVALADDIVGQRTAEQVMSNPALTIISEMAAIPTTKMTETDYANLIEAMNAFHTKLNPAERLMLRLAQDQWNDRPFNTSGLAKPYSAVTGRSL